MRLENKIIERYRQLFPKETLKESSARTGIQITRVYRLFLGKPMKVHELEAFEKAINEGMSTNPNHSRLTYVLEEASALLTNEELGKLADYFERRVENKKFVRSYIRPLFQETNIA